MRTHLLAIGGLLLITVITFHKVLLPPQPIMALDSPLATVARGRANVMEGLEVVYNPVGYLGMGGHEVTYTTRTPLHKFVPLELYNTVLFTLYAFLAGVAGYLLCLALRLSPFAGFVGGSAVMLSGHFITTTFSGHAGTFVMWPMLLLAWALLTVGVERRSILAFFWSGVCAGIGISGQFDVGVIIALCMFAWLVFLIVHTRAQGRWAVLAIGLVLAAAAGFVFMLPQLYYVIGLAGAAEGAGGVAADTRTALEKWSWATQWSLPKMETLSLLVPGFFGYGTPASQYWGAIGQDTRWLTEHVGFPRFSQSTQGVGVAVVALAVMAACCVRDTSRRLRVKFWLVVALVALVFAWGRYFDLRPSSGTGFGPYRLFYWLPKMDSMRNPIKFMYPLMIAVAVLAAYGVDYALSAVAGSHGHAHKSRKKSH
jgi:hypothetical protein